VSRVRCPSRCFASGPTHKFAAVASRWQHVGDLIGLRFKPHTPAPEVDVLPLVILKNVLVY